MSTTSLAPRGVLGRFSPETMALAEEQSHSWAFSDAQLAMIPELRYAVDGQAPIDVLEPYLRQQSGWSTGATIAFGVLSAPPLVVVLHQNLGLGLAWTVAAVICFQMSASWILLGLVFPALRRRRIRAEIRERLRTCGIDPCPKCAYDLRHTPDHCPECGADRESVSRPDS